MYVKILCKNEVFLLHRHGKYNALLIGVVQESVTSLSELFLEKSYLQLLLQCSPPAGFLFSTGCTEAGLTCPKVVDHSGISFYSLSRLTRFDSFFSSIYTSTFTLFILVFYVSLS